MEYIKMRYRPTGSAVHVYALNTDGTALVFDPNAFMNNDQSFKTVKANKLVPMEYPLHNTEVVYSKTKKNKAKDRLRLIDAVWESSDGIRYNHSCIEDAIQHELELMEKEELI